MELRSDQGVEIARFCVDHRDVLGNPSYTRSLWVDIFGKGHTDLDSMLSDLNALEDQVTTELEAAPTCLLVLTISDANSRTLVFAVTHDALGLDAKIVRIRDQAQGKVEARLLDAPNLGPYGPLIKRAGG